MFLMLCLIVFSCIVIKLCYKKKDKKINRFKICNGKFSIYNVLKDIIVAKLNKTIQVNTDINKTTFKKLNLVVAPVYVLDVKKIGLTHLKLFLIAIKDISIKFNLVLIDCRTNLTFLNTNVNIVKLSNNEITYDVMCLLNILNVNKDIKKNDYCFDFELKKFKFNIKECCFSTIFERKGVYKLDLPTNCYGYILKGNEVYDSFGEKMMRIVTKSKVRLEYNHLYFTTNANNFLQIFICYSTKIQNNLCYLNYNIEYEEFNKEIQILKDRAINECCSLFIGDMTKSDFKTLKDFFKVAFMRKQYLSDYIYLIKHIFGINIHNNILKSNPSCLINKDFFVSYEINNQEFKVHYTFTDCNQIKLNCVGHKIGTKDTFAYGV